jgi:hypothetical protein
MAPRGMMRYHTATMDAARQSPVHRKIVSVIATGEDVEDRTTLNL